MSSDIKPFKGQNFYEIKSAHSVHRLFEDTTFPANDSSLCLNRDPPEGIVWMRPKDVNPNARFTGPSGYKFDMDYGALGNCWFVAACLGIIQNRNLFAKVVPDNQSFNENYTGTFHFRFWSYGEWYDIVIDDRLPFWTNGNLVYSSNKTNTDDYWGPLLEKAYAKFQGCYENLNNGQILDALLDMSGGVQERFYISKDKKLNYDFAFWRLLEQSFHKKSIVGCSVFTDPRIRESRMSNGSVKDAFTITGIFDLKKNMDVKLIRIQNPWGNDKEWTGPWSEGTKEWKHLSDEEKREVGYFNRNHGEFWMCFPDFMSYWDQVQICHLCQTAHDPALESSLRLISNINYDVGWECRTYHSEWKSGLTAGGSGTKLQTKFWTNPQFLFSIPEIDPSIRKESKTDVIIALMQKSVILKRLVVPTNHDTCDECIQFKLYKIKNDVLLDENKTTGLKLHGAYLDKIGSSGSYINSREVQGRFRVPPGRYLIIPSTYEENRDSEFLLRIFTEKILSRRSPVQFSIELETKVNREEEDAKAQQIFETKQKEIVVNTEIKITEIVKQEISNPDKEMIESINQQKKEIDHRNEEALIKVSNIKTPDLKPSTEALINEIRNSMTNKELLKSESKSSIVLISTPEPVVVENLSSIVKTTTQIAPEVKPEIQMTTVAATEVKPEIKNTEIQTVSSLLKNLEISKESITNKVEIKNTEIQTSILNLANLVTPTIETKTEIKNIDIQASTDNTGISIQTTDTKTEIKNTELQTSNIINNTEISTQTQRPESQNNGTQVAAPNTEISTQTELVKKSEVPPPVVLSLPVVAQSQEIKLDESFSLLNQSFSEPKTEVRLSISSFVSIDRLNTDELIERIAKDFENSASTHDLLSVKALNESLIYPPLEYQEIKTQPSAITAIPLTAPPFISLPALVEPVIIQKIEPISIQEAPKIQPSNELLPLPAVNEILTLPEVKEVLPPPAVSEVLPPPAVSEVLPLPAVNEVLPPPVVNEVLPFPAVNEVLTLPAVNEVLPPPAVYTEPAPVIQTDISGLNELPPVGFNELPPDVLNQVIAALLNEVPEVLTNPIDPVTSLLNETNQSIVPPAEAVPVQQSDLISVEETNPEINQTTINNTQIEATLPSQSNAVISQVESPKLEEAIDMIVNNLEAQANVNENLKNPSLATFAVTEPKVVLSSPSVSERQKTDDLIEKIAQRLENSSQELVKIETKLDKSFSPLVMNQDVIAPLNDSSQSAINTSALNSPIIQVDPSKPPSVPFKTALKFPPVLLNNVSSF